MKKVYLVSYLQIREMQEIVNNAILVTPKKATEFGIRLYQLSFPCFYMSVRKKYGSHYNISSMKPARAAIDCFLWLLPHSEQMDEKKHYPRLRIQ